MTRAYVIVAGNGLTQFDAEGKAHLYRVGDTIQMTDEDAAGQAKFVRLADGPSAAVIDPAPVRVDEDDER